MMVNNDVVTQIESLRSTLGKMEAALGAISEAIVWTDATGQIQWCNAAFDRLIGKPHIAILGGSIVDLIPLKEHGIPLPEKAHPVSLTLKNKIDKSGYYEFVRGERAIPLEIVGRYLEVGPTEPSVVIVMRDMTRVKEIEQVRLQSTALEATANAIVITDREGCVIWFNRAFTVLTGYSLDEVYGKTLNFLKSGAHGDGFYRNLWETILSGKVWEDETINQKKDGSRYVEQQMITPVRNEDGEITHFVAVKQDISDRKDADAALKDSEARIRAIVNTAVDGIITANERGIIQSFNPAAEKLFGYSRDEVIGQNLNTLMPSPYREEHDTYLANYLHTGKRKVIGKGREAIARRKDGTTFPMDLSVSEMHVGQRRMFTGIVRDVTQRKEFEKQLLEAKEAAERANQTKSEFLANMSHEIRTPMNSIMGFTEILLDEALPAQQREAMETIRGSSERLLTLINEILDLSKIEADSLVLEKIPFKLKNLVLQAMEWVRPQVEQKHIELRSHFEGDLKTVVGDPTRLQQILLNLLSNSIKFTEQGEILLTARVLEETESRVRVEMAVKDTGIGIPEDKKDAIFEAFTQADGSTTRKYGGTGLGLTISRRLIGLMGGEIGVDSRVGEGTTFNFDLWLLKGTPEDSSIEWAGFLGERASGKGLSVQAPALTVLLAEDDLASQKMTIQMLEKMGHTVTLAGDGSEAVAMARHTTFDVILMDMQMPVMGGLEATDKLRKAGYTGPIIALTASAMRGDREYFMEQGMDGYIAKPIRRDMVLDILNRFGSRKTADSTPEEAGSPPLRSALEELGLSKEEYLEILQDFMGEKREEMDALKNGVRDGDTETIRQLAHKLKGSASNLRLEALAAVAERMELKASQGDISQIHTELEQMIRELERVGQAPAGSPASTPGGGEQKPGDSKTLPDLVHELNTAVRANNLTQVLGISGRLLSSSQQNGLTRMEDLAREISDHARQANLSGMRDTAKRITTAIEEEST